MCFPSESCLQTGDSQTEWLQFVREQLYFSAVSAEVQPLRNEFSGSESKLSAGFRCEAVAGARPHYKLESVRSSELQLKLKKTKCTEIKPRASEEIQKNDSED